ncbi:MAG: hypothetical protein LQ339_005840 [Xanthoria mediterranea]|nr:MAG: hypothetical protein LQ339_005840 [Xanthoria mediterranea]
MLYSIVCVCTYLLIILPTRISSLVARPQLATSSDRFLDVNFTKAELTVGGAGSNNLRAPTPLTSSWCRPASSELDLLFSTHGGQPLLTTHVMYAIGVFREVIDEMAKERGPSTTCGRRSLRITSRGVAVTIFDPLLAEQNWQDIHDAIDILLLCCYLKKVSAELAGTLFDIEKMKRFASVAIAEAQVPRADGNITES